LREGLQRVRSGETRRLDGRFPDEVDPLVREVNDLLLAQETAIERARSRAADLAHGLKTPLTVLTADAARLQAKGETEISTELLDLAGAMRRQVDQELVRARIDATRRTVHPPLPVAPAAERLMRAMQRMPKGETLAWDSSIPPEITLAVDPDDLAEMLGNLLDNAVKWARHEIRLTASRSAAGTDLSVEDDGPGVPADQIAALGRRGVRLDRTVQGSGRGLAIVGDIIAAYGGEILFDAMRPETAPAPLGGLRVTLHFPPRPGGREPSRPAAISE
jgi:signal transduction histidine kinase